MIRKSYKLFCLFFVIGATIQKAYAHDIEVDNDDDVTIYYNWINNNTELEVSYRGGSNDSFFNEYVGDIVIPPSVTYNGKVYRVTSIGSEAFMNNFEVTRVTVPESVTNIGNQAFYSCSSLRRINIPSSVTNIGDQAFYYCKILTKVTIPEGVTSIGNGAFSHCAGLTSMTIPEGVTSIGNGAFSNCYGLTSVTIPSSVTSIGNRTFYNCTGLTCVTIPSSVTDIGEDAFDGCTGMTDVTNLAVIPQKIHYGTFGVYGTLHVLPGCKTVYQNASGWDHFNIVEDAVVSGIGQSTSEAQETKVTGLFNINGHQLPALQPGLNIIKMSNGTTKKVMVK